MKRYCIICNKFNQSLKTKEGYKCKKRKTLHCVKINKNNINIELKIPCKKCKLALKTPFINCEQSCKKYLKWLKKEKEKEKK